MRFVPIPLTLPGILYVNVFSSRFHYMRGHVLVRMQEEILVRETTSRTRNQENSRNQGLFVLFHYQVQDMGLFLPKAVVPFSSAALGGAGPIFWIRTGGSGAKPGPGPDRCHSAHWTWDSNCFAVPDASIQQIIRVCA
jgi:hypothetical protein